MMTTLQARTSADDSRTRIYTIGPWRFCADDGVLSRAGVQRRLEDRSARTLVMLCQRRGEVVAQPDILANVWNGRAVSANSVSIVIGDIRRALGDDPLGPAYIETVPKRGYRLRPDTPPAARPVERARNPKITRRIMIAAGAAAALGVLGLGLWRTGAPAPVRIVSEPVQNDTGRPDLDRLARALGTLVDLQLARLPGVVVAKGGDLGSHGLLFRSKLILWNDQPTLSLEAVDPRTGTVRWAGMADGPASALAGDTIAQIGKFTVAPARR